MEHRLIAYQGLGAKIGDKGTDKVRPVKPAVVVGNSVGDVFEANGGEVRSDASLVSPNFVSTDNYYLWIRPRRASDCSMIYSNAAPFFDMTRIY